MATRSNMNFQQIKLGTSVIPHFHVILTRESISENVVFIEGDLQGQKVNFNSSERKHHFLTNTARNVWDFD